MARVGGSGTPGHRGDGKPTAEIKVRVPEQTAPGVYANSMMVHHTGNEFVMDFAFVLGSVGTVVARVISSPGHTKRIVAALQDNLKRYERTHGPIVGSGDPPSAQIDLHSSEQQD